MNTFLPYANFKASAKILDYKRLGKQRVEVYQLLRAMNGESEGWKNHPCCKMWWQYEEALIDYGVAMCDEWIHRGYNDTLREQILNFSAISTFDKVQMPDWLGRESFHASHRSNLLRKDPAYYGQFGWIELPIMPYEWPT